MILLMLVSPALPPLTGLSSLFVSPFLLGLFLGAYAPVP